MIPARQTGTLQFEMRFERILDLDDFKEIRFDPRLFSEWNWSLMLTLDNATTITASCPHKGAE